MSDKNNNIKEINIKLRKLIKDMTKLIMDVNNVA
jgi:hypothetical protein